MKQLCCEYETVLTKQINRNIALVIESKQYMKSKMSYRLPHDIYVMQIKIKKSVLTLNKKGFILLDIFLYLIKNYYVKIHHLGNK